MIPPECQAEILRLFHAEHWKVGTIATQLGLHHTTVRRVLTQAGVAIAKRSERPSIADPYIPFIRETLTRYPRLRSSRLYAMVRERGYPGGPDHFRAVVARHRPRPVAEAYLRLRTLPGEQAQVDWAHFGKVPIGRAVRPLMAFVIVLSWSRQIFLRFFLGQAMGCFLRGHVDAFECWGGVPRVLLYDNLRSAVLERRGDAIRFHPTLLELAAHYRFEPRPVAIARGNEKGRVERAIQYARHSFFAARTWTDLDDLNAQALAWCDGIAADRRCPEDTTLPVREAFATERPRLLALPDDRYPAADRVEVHVGKTPYVRFDGNDYSVPHDHVRRTLVVIATETTVRVLEGADTVATHARSYDRGVQIEDPAHEAALVAHKREARRHRQMDRLHHATPASRAFFRHVAERGGNLGTTTRELVRLLDAYGAPELDAALAEATARERIHLHAVRQILDRRRHERGAPPPLAVELPDDPRARNLVVTPHDLASYDALDREETPDEDTSE